MRMLLTNDDGIHAPGLRALHDAVSDLGEARVVAPSSERSAAGHSVTMIVPLRARTVHLPGGQTAFAVKGTPADCVKLAVSALLPETPELVISGINDGHNAGVAVLYSGTVSAAMEGAMMGIPSLAISLRAEGAPHWDTAARAARELVQRHLQNPLPRHMLLNVNVPNLPWEDIRGYRVTRMGLSRYVETFEERRDPRGHRYYWMDGKIEVNGPQDGTDLEALDQGCIALTPLHFDLTHEPSLAGLRTWAPGA